jgi:metal-sulfur cluster biosynthetic enzyme
MKTSFHKFMASNAVKEVSNVELGAVKVELGIVDDFEMDADALEVGVKREIGDFMKAKQVLESVKTNLDIREKFIANAMKVYAEIEKQAKFMGIDVPPKAIASLKKVNIAKKVVESLRNDIKAL